MYKKYKVNKRITNVKNVVKKIISMDKKWHLASAIALQIFRFGTYLNYFVDWEVDGWKFSDFAELPKLRSIFGSWLFVYK